MFGNLLRAGSQIASSFSLPGAQLVSKLLPDAPPYLQQVALNAVAEATTGPVLKIAEAKTFASMVKEQVSNAGGTPTESANIGAVAFAAASLPPVQAAVALESASSQIPVVNNFGKTEIKTILNGAVNGARDGATSAYLNETQMGKEQKKGAINAEGAKIMPWVIGGSFALIAWLLSRKN